MQKIKFIDIRIVLVLIAGAFLSQCVQIKYSTSGASIPPEAKTFSVQYMNNNAPIVNPLLTQQFTDELKDRLESQTPLKQINGVGDLDFEGEITGYDVRPVAIQGDDLAAKNRFTITIRVRYANALDPTYEFDKSFSRYEDFDGNQDLQQVEDGLVEKIIERLVEDVFNESVVNW